jgi:hypothetical protein
MPGASLQDIMSLPDVGVSADASFGAMHPFNTLVRQRSISQGDIPDSIDRLPEMAPMQPKVEPIPARLHLQPARHARASSWGGRPMQLLDAYQQQQQQQQQQKGGFLPQPSHLNPQYMAQHRRQLEQQQELLRRMHESAQPKQEPHAGSDVFLNDHHQQQQQEQEQQYFQEGLVFEETEASDMDQSELMQAFDTSVLQSECVAVQGQAVCMCGGLAFPPHASALADADSLSFLDPSHALMPPAGLTSPQLGASPLHSPSVYAHSSPLDGGGQPLTPSQPAMALLASLSLRGSSGQQHLQHLQQQQQQQQQREVQEYRGHTFDDGSVFPALHEAGSASTGYTMNCKPALVSPPLFSSHPPPSSTIPNTRTQRCQPWACLRTERAGWTWEWRTLTWSGLWTTEKRSDEGRPHTIIMHTILYSLFPSKARCSLRVSCSPRLRRTSSPSQEATSRSAT